MFASSKKKKYIIAATIFIAAAIIAVIMLFAASPCLVLRGKDGREFAAIPFEGEQRFAVSFIHSVNKTQVKEGYYIRDNKIILDYCLYYGFGAGVATEKPQNGSLEFMPDGSMLMTGFEQEISSLSYIVGTVSDHILYINDGELSLRELCGRNSMVKFSVEKRLFK